MNICALCKRLVRFGPEFMLLKMITFVAILQKLAHHAKYLRISWTVLYNLYRFGRHIWIGMITVTFF